MKKSHLFFVSLISFVFMVLSCSKDDDSVSLEGTWEAITITYDNAYDFDNDSVETTDFREEYPCIYSDRLVFNSNGTGSRSIISPIVWVLSPAVRYECVPGTQSSQSFRWIYNPETNEVRSTMSVVGGEFSFEFINNQLIYKIPTNTLRQTYTGDLAARDTLRFVFERLP